jgi:hypothetical protein
LCEAPFGPFRQEVPDAILGSLGSLSPEQVAALRRQLDQLAPSFPKATPVAATPTRPRKAAAVTVFDLLDQAGLIGCIKGKPGSPTDLATNPEHMEGFGRG